MAGGTWLTARHDGRNLARADVAGSMSEAPYEAWRLPTGAEVRYARTIEHSAGEAVLVQAGTTLQVVAWAGRRLWSAGTLGVKRVLYAGRLGAARRGGVLVALDERTVALLDLDDGSVAWTWSSEESSDLSGPGASKVFTGPDGSIRWVCFPTYSTRGVCVDLGRQSSPEIVWEVDLEAAYDAGFGPNVIVADVFGRGSDDVVISSRTGDAYDGAGDGTETPSTQLVLGRENGALYQAVLAGDSGATIAETSYRPDPDHEYPCARPYGLLQAVPLRGDGFLDLVLVSCQVEEYAAVTANDGGRLRRRWGSFVERDWPQDRLELRPQVTSLADLRGEGSPELILGFWDGARWTTLVVDPLTGLADGTRTELPGKYFWGCHDLDGDGRDEILVSSEGRRRPARSTTLEAIDGRTLERKAALDEASLLLSTDSDLPAHVNFLADRRNPIAVEGRGGRIGVLVRRASSELEWWGSDGAGGMVLRPLPDGRFARADWHGGELILSDSAGRLARLDEHLRETDRLESLNGRFCQPLVWKRRGGRELVVDLADGHVLGGRPAQDGTLQAEWRVEGMLPALHRDPAGTCRLSVADDADPHAPRVQVHEEPGSARSTPVTIELRAPAAGALTPLPGTFALLVNLRTGMHTAGLAVYDADGRLAWEDPDFGGHPQRPGLAPVGDENLVVADDHGRLRIYDSRGQTVAENDWTAAYTVPIAVPSEAGTPMIVRADGIHGVEQVDLEGSTVWRTTSPLWRYFPGRSAVGRLGVGRRWTLGSVARDGTFDALDVDTGAVRWTVALGPVPAERAVASGDIDGDGSDEFLVGTCSSLVCLAEDGYGRGRELWRCALPAAATNPVIADVDGDGEAEILVSTADGFVRLFRASRA